MARNLLRFLKTPKTAAQIIAEFGPDQVPVMRALSNRGDIIMCAPASTNHGEVWLYWAKPAKEGSYLRRRLAALGADREREIII